jgi:FkbM family methyltransferase
MQQAALNLTLNGVERPFIYRKGTSDEHVITQVLKNQEYSLTRLRRGQELAALYERIAASGRAPLIVDAGANIGASAVYFACLFPKARVVAIEPERSNFELLTLNTSGLPVECRNAALAAAPGALDVIDAGEGAWGYRTAPAGAAQAVHAVECATMNDLYAAHAGCAPFMVKIDIEGGEGALFAANTEWIDRTPLIVIELHDWLLPRGRTSASFLTCMAARDRDFVSIGENVFSIANDGAL